MKLAILLQKPQCCGAARVDAAIETRIAAGMAGAAAGLLDVEDDCVLVAVGAHFDDFLDLPRSRTLVPDFLTRARPVDGLAFFEGETQGLAIHPREHQGFARMGIDRHRRDESIFIKLGRKFESVFDLFLVETWSKAGVRFVVHARRVGEKGNLASRKQKWRWHLAALPEVGEKFQARCVRGEPSSHSRNALQFR